MGNYREMIHSFIGSTDARILEIGPLNRPLIKREQYPNVLYCDIRSTAEVKALYADDDYLKVTNISIPIEDIVGVDVVLKDSYEKTFSSLPKFDYIVASHVLEHVEDLLFFLQDVSKVLAEGGKLIIYYPDKRYCFDHFRSEASFRDAYDVYKKGRGALSRMVLDFFLTAINENAEIVFWNAADMQMMLPNNDKEKAFDLYERSNKGEFIDDVHYWPFSDAGFLKFIYDAVRTDFIRLNCHDFCPTQQNTQEFLVVLGKNDDEWNKEAELLSLRDKYAAVANRYYNTQSVVSRFEIKELEAETKRLNSVISIKEQQIIAMERDIQVLNAQISEREERIKCVVTDYENSKSWRITRPFRAIVRLIKRRH